MFDALLTFLTTNFPLFIALLGDVLSGGISIIISQSAGGIGINIHKIRSILAIIFSKFTNCISGPNDDIVVPKNSNHTDWEVEIGFVIGKKALYVTKENALEHQSTPIHYKGDGII